MKMLTPELDVRIAINPAAGDHQPAVEPLISWRAAQMKARLERLRLIANNGAPLPPRSARRHYNEADLRLAARAFARLVTVPPHAGPITVNRALNQLES